MDWGGGVPLGKFWEILENQPLWGGAAPTWELVAVVIVCGSDAYGVAEADLLWEIETYRGKIPVRYASARPDVGSHIYGIDATGCACIMPLVRP